MEKLKWVAVIGGFAYASATAFNLIGAATNGAGHGEILPYTTRSEPTLRSGGEEVEWESDNGFSRFYRSTGFGAGNSALANFRNKWDGAPDGYGETESALAKLASSLNLEDIRFKLTMAKQTGAPAVVLRHYEYLNEILIAFLEGRLPELALRMRGTDPDLH